MNKQGSLIAGIIAIALIIAAIIFINNNGDLPVGPAINQITVNGIVDVELDGTIVAPDASHIDFIGGATVVPDGSGATVNVVAGGVESPSILSHRIAGGRFSHDVDGLGFSGTQVMSADTMYAFPFLIGDTALTFDEWWTFVNGGSPLSVIRMCIYDDNGSSYPGNLVDDTGVVAGSTTGNKLLMISPAHVLNADTLYWLIYYSDGTPQLLRGTGVLNVLGEGLGGFANYGYAASRTYDATCPSTYPAAAPFFTSSVLWAGLVEAN